jgi:hypothetical protein
MDHADEFRSRAEQARAKAEKIADAECKRMMFGIADMLYPSTRTYMSRSTMTGEKDLCAIHRDDNDDVFVVVGGVKIAKRSLRRTTRAATWIMLQPGWLVRDVEGGRAIEVRYAHAEWIH